MINQTSISESIPAVESAIKRGKNHATAAVPLEFDLYKKVHNTAIEERRPLAHVVRNIVEDYYMALEQANR